MLVELLYRVARAYYFRDFFNLAFIYFCNNSQVRSPSQINVTSCVQCVYP